MRYDEIMQNVKNDRVAAAVAAAAQLYLRDGISGAKMTDIADQAQIGVASLYRYFGTKQLFTVKVGAYIWRLTLRELEPFYTGSVYQTKTGYEQVEALLNIFHTLMKDFRPFLRFLSEFDTFVIREKLSTEHLGEYETCVLNILPVMEAAIEKGKRDGTIREETDGTMFYFTVTDCLLSMCQRFVWGNVPNSEDSQLNRRALAMAIEMFLGYIRT